MKITLCGSARFEAEFKALDKELTLAGHIVYSLAVYPSDEAGKDWYSPREKTTLDLVHLGKILNSEAIVVIDGVEDDARSEPYVGESTSREIEWARINGKLVFMFSNTNYDVSRLVHHVIDSAV